MDHPMQMHIRLTQLIAGHSGRYSLQMPAGRVECAPDDVFARVFYKDRAGRTHQIDLRPVFIENIAQQFLFGAWTPASDRRDAPDLPLAPLGEPMRIDVTEIGPSSLSCAVRSQQVRWQCWRDEAILKLSHQAVDGKVHCLVLTASFLQEMTQHSIVSGWLRKAA